MKAEIKNIKFFPFLGDTLEFEMKKFGVCSIDKDGIVNFDEDGKNDLSVRDMHLSIDHIRKILEVYEKRKDYEVEE